MSEQKTPRVYTSNNGRRFILIKDLFRYDKARETIRVFAAQKLRLNR
jgi:hypothetical protein